MKAADRSSYDELKATADRARDAYEAIGDPYKDIRELDAKEREHRAIADLAPKLAAAEAQIAEIDRNIAETQATADAAQQRVREITGELLAMDAAIKRADALLATIKAQEPLADTLGECRAAAATVAALEPQIQELYREAGELEEKRKEAVRAANVILARIPTETVNLSGLRAIRDGHRKTLNDLPPSAAPSAPSWRPSRRRRPRPSSSARRPRPSRPPSTTTPHWYRLLGLKASST